MTDEIVLTHALRTPFARAGTALRSVSAVELGRQVVTELIARSDIDPERVDEVVVGCAGSPAEASNIARVVALRADLPQSIPASTVQRNCGSGFDAITTAAERIRAGRATVVVAGAVESMSNYPLLFPESGRKQFTRIGGARSWGGKLVATAGLRPSHFRPRPAQRTGLTDPVSGLNMGETAEALAQEFGIKRERQDEFALRSHQRAVTAEAAGEFDDERVDIFLPDEAPGVVDLDLGPRSGQSLEALNDLRPIFDRRHGTVTAGNSCQLTDGAAATLVMSGSAASELGYEPLGRLAGYAWAGVDPRRMGLGPSYAIPAALEDAGRALDDMDRVEINEAFAAQVLAVQLCMRSRAFARDELGASAPLGEVPEEILNVNGGAIAIGHPVGATGMRLVATLLHSMQRNGLRHALASLCIGGGQGGAVVLER
ncbi:MAG: acetyl-CoA C-acyltransferase [Acidobacteria bacterium]|nr:acetyl-CoA C-acyltransferase [Acidobacteriota bacterium]